MSLNKSFLSCHMSTPNFFLCLGREAKSGGDEPAPPRAINLRPPRPPLLLPLHRRQHRVRRCVRRGSTQEMTQMTPPAPPGISLSGQMCQTKPAMGAAHKVTLVSSPDVSEPSAPDASASLNSPVASHSTGNAAA